MSSEEGKYVFYSREEVRWAYAQHSFLLCRLFYMANVNQTSNKKKRKKREGRAGGGQSDQRFFPLSPHKLENSVAHCLFMPLTTYYIGNDSWQEALSGLKPMLIYVRLWAKWTSQNSPKCQFVMRLTELKAFFNFWPADIAHKEMAFTV